MRYYIGTNGARAIFKNAGLMIVILAGWAETWVSDDTKPNNDHQGMRKLAAGAHIFEVPASGLIEIRQQDDK